MYFNAAIASFPAVPLSLAESLPQRSLPGQGEIHSCDAAARRGNSRTLSHNQSGLSAQLVIFCLALISAVCRTRGVQR